MTTLRSLVLASAVLFVPAAASADTACPAAVKTAIDKAFAKSTITRCKAEKEHGHDQFEVKLTKADGASAEVDVSPDGKILQVEEKIAAGLLPQRRMGEPRDVAQAVRAIADGLLDYSTGQVLNVDGGFHLRTL